MILEVAPLVIRPGQTAAFEAEFAVAEPILMGSSGYLGHELQRCIEDSQRYLLLVRWNTLQDHSPGFRSSAGYSQWKQLLHHFYDPFPVVEHFERVSAPRLTVG